MRDGPAHTRGEGRASDGKDGEAVEARGTAAGQGGGSLRAAAPAGCAPLATVWDGRAVPARATGRGAGATQLGLPTGPPRDRAGADQGGRSGQRARGEQEAHTGTPPHCLMMEVFPTAASPITITFSTCCAPSAAPGPAAAAIARVPRLRLPESALHVEPGSAGLEQPQIQCPSVAPRAQQRLGSRRDARAAARGLSIPPPLALGDRALRPVAPGPVSGAKVRVA